MSAPTSALQVSGTFTVSSTVTGISPALYVSTSGNVGIGTSTPTNLFAIHQSEDTTPATVNSYGFRVLNKGSSAVSIGADATYNYIQGWNRPLQINNVGNNTLFNVGGGSAGIGTTSPNATLNVSGSFNVSTSAQTSSNPSLYVTTSGNVGIGTTSPNGLLEVNKNQNGLTEARVINANTGASAQARYTLATGTANAYILSTVLDNSAAPYYQMSAGAGIQNAFFDFPNFKFRSTGGTDWLTVGSSSIAATLPMTITNSTGGWGLHVTTPNSYGIYSVIGNSGYAVKGDDATNGSSGILGYVGWGTMCLSGTCGGFSAYQNLSDERTKTKIHDLPTKDGLASILKLRPVRFHWKDAKKDKLEGEKLGFIAQDIEKVFPEVVVDSRIDTSVTTVDGKKESVKNAKTLSYGDLVVPVVKSIQELKAENDNLVSKTGALEAQLKAANDNIEELRHELRDLKNGVGFKRAVGQ